MKPDQKILGYVITRNAWPMVGLAVLNALQKGVSHVIIVDHSSDSQTHRWLRTLQHSRPNEISLHRTNTTRLLQRATYLSVLRRFPTSTFDWVYTFDSDEFIYLDNNLKLTDVLNDVPPNIDAIRYEIVNYVTPFNFDVTNVQDFLRIDQRSVIDPNVVYESEIVKADLVAGAANFFDIPFPPKVITRESVFHNLQTGGHSAVGAAELNVGTELFAMHVPFSSKSNLVARATQGGQVSEHRAAAGESWQQRALYEIQQKGDLDGFWLSHTIPVDGNQTQVQRKRPRTVVDKNFSTSLRSVIGEMDAFTTLQPMITEITDVTPSISSIDEVIELVEELDRSISQEVFQQLTTNHQQLITDHQQLTTNHQQLTTNHQQLITDHQQLATNLEMARDAQFHLTEEVLSLRNSRAFRLGRLLLSPLTTIRKLLRPNCASSEPD